MWHTKQTTSFISIWIRKLFCFSNLADHHHEIDKDGDNNNDESVIKAPQLDPVCIDFEITSMQKPFQDILVLNLYI